MNDDFNDLPKDLVLSEDFGDPETLFNSRDWLTKAVEAQGAKFTGGGVGMGQADIDIELEGMRFNISIKPLTDISSKDLSGSDIPAD